MSSIIELELSKITALSSRPVLKDPLTIISIRRDEVKILTSDAKRAITALLREAKSEVKEIKAQITALSPLSTLKRGYAVIQKKGRVVTNSKDVLVSDQLAVRLAKGELTVEVINESKVKGK
jgi:exodeoxyribonuclease VII large subunit